MTTYLITGGAGFIGSHLADALVATGCKVRVLDDLSTGRKENLQPAVELIEGDVCDPAQVADAMVGCAGIFHLAAIASVDRANKDWLGAHRINLGATVAVLEEALRAGRLPVVLASSAAVYGVGSDERLCEDHPTLPISAYGADKLGCELHARIGVSVHGLPSIAFRFFNVYGPRQDPHSPYSGVISIFTDRIAAGKEIILNGDGQQVRDFVYVGDVVQHLVAGMRKLHREGCVRACISNVCTGYGTTIERLADLLADVMDTRVQKRFGPPRAGDIPISVGSRDFAERHFGLPQPLLLRDGLSLLAASWQR